MTAVDLLGGIIEANMEKNKRPALKKVSISLEKLRIFVRVAKDLRFLDFKKYERVQEKIDGVGKMLGGWIKWAGDRRSA